MKKLFLKVCFIFSNIKLCTFYVILQNINFQQLKLNIMKTHFFALMTVFILLGCSKNDEPPKTPVDQLPPATQVGANKVGCLVNGEVFLPKGSNPLGPPIVTCYYQYVNNGFEFGLSFSNDSNGLRYITILSNKLEFTQGAIYNIKQQDADNSLYAFYTPQLNQGFRTTESFTGTLQITKLDLSNNIISGTFKFDAVKLNSGEIVKITEGRFDMKYSQ
jgi:hypothetical protein